MDYTTKDGDPLLQDQSPPSAYEDINTTIRRLQLRLYNLQGIPDRIQQAQSIYGSLSPGEKQYQSKRNYVSKYFKASGAELKHFFLQCFPSSYNVPSSDKSRTRLKTWAYGEIQAKHLPPDIKSKKNVWTFIQLVKLQFNIIDGKPINNTQVQKLYRIKEHEHSIEVSPHENTSDIVYEWNDEEQEKDNNWTTYCGYIVASNPGNTNLIKNNKQISNTIKTQIGTLQKQIDAIKETTTTTSTSTTDTTPVTPTGVTPVHIAPGIPPDIEDRLTQMQTDINAIKTTNNDMKEDIQELKEDCQCEANHNEHTSTDLETKIKTNTDDITQMKEDIQDLIEDMPPDTTLWDTITKITANASSAISIANNVRQLTNEKMQTTLSKIANVSTIVNNATESIRNVAETVETVSNAVDSITNTINNLKETIENLKENPPVGEAITATINEIKETVKDQVKEQVKPPNFTIRIRGDTVEL